MTKEFHSDFRAAIDESIKCGFRGRYGNKWRAGVEYSGHGFWIHTTNISMGADGSKTVTGQISHRLKWRPDDQCYFTYIYDKAGKLIKAESAINNGGFSAIAAPVTAAIGAVVAIFCAPVGVGIINASTTTPALTRPIEDLFTGSWESALNMLLAEIAVQTAPGLRFYWSHDGDWIKRPAGYVSINICEPSDPNTWGDNFLLIENPANCDWKWTHKGLAGLPGYTFISFNEPADPHTWSDNYLCYKGTGKYDIKFSCAGPLPGYAVTQIGEPADPYTWTDNYLCYRSAI